MLYPQTNAYRHVYNLNGIWNFAMVPDDYVPRAPLENARPMAVPASMNEIFTQRGERDYMGKVLYEREFSVPQDKTSEYRLRLGAVSHKCEIYINGRLAGKGDSGFYPVDIALPRLREKNVLSVLIDNRLDFSTLPPGRIEDGRQTINFDFFNYTGIHRDVLLYTRPPKPIEDIAVHTVAGGDYGKIRVDVQTDGKIVALTVKDANGNAVASASGGEIRVPAPRLWSPDDPYLYTLDVTTETDAYEQTFGIRKVSFDATGLFLNDKRVYLQGFGMHEDFALLGKGNNAAVNVRDFELLRWIGANSIRTSHYPYSEEIMDLADRYGIMVIDEVPAVGMNAFRGGNNFAPDRLNETTEKLHKQLITALMARDKNHPCVVMLSVANEPATEEEGARAYFQNVIAHARTVTDLPITLAEVTKLGQNSRVADLVDFTALNRYYGWYEEHGNLYRTQPLLTEELQGWHRKYGKPVIVTEFGADTVEGTHALPAETFSEEYQTEFLEENCRVLDTLPFVAGEHVWNFADFKTKQGVIRVRGNRKGVFTRERQPKAAAFFLKKRWHAKKEQKEQ